MHVDKIHTELDWELKERHDGEVVENAEQWSDSLERRGGEKNKWQVRKRESKWQKKSLDQRQPVLCKWCYSSQTHLGLRGGRHAAG